MFGKRGIGQLYEIGRVTSVNSNGTLDVLINGRSVPYSELQSLIDPRIHRDGMVVVVGKAYGNSYMPFVLGDTRSYKSVIPVNFVPPVVISLYDWSCSRSNPKQNFLSGLPGFLFDISYGEDSDLSPTKMDLFTQNGVFVGLLNYKVVLDEEEGTEIDVFGVKNAKGSVTTSGFRDEFYSFLPNQFINDSTDLIYESTVNDMLTTCYYNSYNAYVFIPELTLLALFKRRRISSSIQATSQVIVIDAISGSTPGGIAKLDGDLVTPYNIFTKNYIIDSGYVNANGRIIKTHHQHQYTHNYTTNVTTDSSALGLNKTIVSINLETGADVWTWDPNMVHNGETLPHLYEVVSCSDISENLTATASPSFDNTYLKSSISGFSSLWPLGIGNNILLPGNNGVYLFEKDYVVIPICARRAHNGDSEIWVNPLNGTYESPVSPGLYATFDYTSVHGRLRYTEKGPIGITTASVGFFDARARTIGEVTDNVVGISSSPAFLSAGGIVDFFPSSASPASINSKIIYNYLIALKAADTISGERVAWKYTFPALDATNSDNYFIDTDSFSKVSSSDKMQAYIDYWTDIIAAYPPTESGSLSSTPNSTVVAPDQVYTDGYTFSYSTTGDPNAGIEPYCNLSYGYSQSDSFTMDIQGEFTEYLYWPSGATYLWDCINFTQAGNKGGSDISLPKTNTSLVADSNENVYGVYLKPMLFVSCASLDHHVDFSLASRINPTPSATWNTLYNGYESDAETIRPDIVNVWGTEIINGSYSRTISYGDPSSSTGPSDPCTVLSDVQARTTNVVLNWYGFPNKYVKFKSFFVKFDSDGNLKWEKELTTYMDERIDDSPNLDGQIPYPGCTLRIIPTTAGIFVLRAVRLPIQTGLRESAIACRNITGLSQDYISNVFNSKVVLELRDYETGDNLWDDEVVIFDPTYMAPSWLSGVSMFGSEASSAGLPWVIGRVDYTKNHSAKTLLIDNPPDYGAGVYRISKVFTCDANGVLTIRNALDDTEDFNDFGTNGCWPYDYVNPVGFDNGYVRQHTPLLMDGVIHYPGEDALYSYGTGIPPV